ncbi:MAG: enoyl-CoA hydratase-related protein [Chloroflexota bacterium]
MSYQLILTEKRNRVGLVTLNRPPVNALNAALLAELMDALSAFDADADIGAMIVTGNERAFAAGADIKEMAAASPETIRASGFISSFDRIRAIKKPVIAAVSGFALGGGCEVALSCDMIIAAQTAIFGQPEVTIGVIPGAGGTQRLTRAVGKVLAMEMVLNNRTLTAEEALQAGMVNRVVPVDQLLSQAFALAEEIASRAPLAVQAAKLAVNKADDLSLSAGLEFEREAFYALFATQDQKEGMQAFMEKRPPIWKGE